MSQESEPPLSIASAPPVSSSQLHTLRVGVLAGRPELNFVTFIGNEVMRPVFWDAATALAEALDSRGLSVGMGVNEIVRSGTNYVFGFHGLGATTRKGVLPRGSVIINSEPIANPEQVSGHIDWATYLPLLDGMHVWDYSRRNVDAFVRANVPSASYAWVPIGYAQRNVSSLTLPPGTQDIDVLFYGRINERRGKTLEQLRDAGLRVYAAEGGVEGTVRDQLVARSKVVLNIGVVPDSVFEQYRVSYMLNNGKAVVTEMHTDERLPDEYTAALAVAPYDELAATCVRLVRDDALRLQLEAAAPLALQSTFFAERLDAALATIAGRAG